MSVSNGMSGSRRWIHAHSRPFACCAGSFILAIGVWPVGSRCWERTGSGCAAEQPVRQALAAGTAGCPTRGRLMAQSAILIVTERPLFPADKGSRARIRSLVRSLRELGFRVVLVARRPSRLIDRLRMRRIVDALTLVEARAFAGGCPSDYDCGPFREAIRDAVTGFRR